MDAASILVALYIHPTGLLWLRNPKEHKGRAAFHGRQVLFYGKIPNGNELSLVLIPG
jgi:hypothetical protein